MSQQRRFLRSLKTELSYLIEFVWATLVLGIAGPVLIVLGVLALPFIWVPVLWSKIARKRRRL
jgi:hypothetical protein